MEAISTQVAFNAMELDEIIQIRGPRKKKKDMGGLSSDAGQHLEEEEPLKLWGDQENGVMGA